VEHTLEQAEAWAKAIGMNMAFSCPGMLACLIVGGLIPHGILIVLVTWSGCAISSAVVGTHLLDKQPV
jgi:hypothetical protein